MSRTLPAGRLDLPSSAHVAHPPRLMLHALRPAFAAYAKHRFALTVRNPERFPASGPVVVVANHIGFVDGPLMAIMSRRPVHALTKREMFHGVMGHFLTASGQVPVWRYQVDPAAVKATLRILRDGGCVGIFPEGTRGAGEVNRVEAGAAYFAMATGAQVLPLAFLGTRVPGGSLNSIPPSGTTMAMSYGEPMSVAPQPWPRRTSDVRALSEEIRSRLLATLREAEAATGMHLPGPVPGEEEAA